VNALEHEHLLGDVGTDDLRDDNVLVVTEQGGDRLAVVRLFDEVELRA
jgi:hypothetical protein